MSRIGSRGNCALAAVRAPMEFVLSAEEIARRSLRIAADVCVNANIVIESLDRAS